MKKILTVVLFAVLILPQISSKGKPGFAHDESRRKKISQEILDNLIDEKYDAVRKDFTEGLKQNLPSERISEVWRYTISVNGAFKKVLSVSIASDKGYNQVRMRLQFEKENLTQETTFTEDDKVGALYIKP